MGSQLDLDDVVAGHPLAQVELAELRAKVVRLRAPLSEEETMFARRVMIEATGEVVDFDSMQAPLSAILPMVGKVEVPDGVMKLLRNVRAEYIGRERPAGDGCDAETWDRIEAMLNAAPTPPASEEKGV